MSSHAKLGLSKSTRWMHCPGSVAMEHSAGGDSQSPQAAIGSASHAVVAHALPRKTSVHELKSCIGKPVKDFTDDDSDIVYDEQMWESNKTYLEFVRELGATANLEFIETRVKLSSISTDLWGTLDYGCVTGIHNPVLHVVDYKDGFVVVDEEHNTQMLSYALGIIDMMPHAGFRRVELSIVQPRAPHVSGPCRTFVATMAYMSGFREELRKARENVLKTPNRLDWGSWCKYCKGSPDCPAMSVEVDAAIALGVRGIERATPAQIAKILEMKDVLGDLLDKAEERGMGIVESGYPLIGDDGLPWSIKERYSNRRWVDGVDTGDLADECYTKKLKTPAQVEKTDKNLRPWVKENTYTCVIGKKLIKQKGDTACNVGDFRE